MGEISLAKVNAINKIVTIDKLLEILFLMVACDQSLWNIFNKKKKL